MFSSKSRRESGYKYLPECQILLMRIFFFGCLRAPPKQLYLLNQAKHFFHLVLIKFDLQVYIYIYSLKQIASEVLIKREGSHKSH